MDAKIITLTQQTQENKMSATPYELRAQLLRQAEGILMNRYQIELDKIRDASSTTSFIKSLGF